MHCADSHHVLAFCVREIDMCEAVLAFDCGITISEKILRRFDWHQFIVMKGQKVASYSIYLAFFLMYQQVAGWPSGLRRQFKALVFGRGFESHFSHVILFLGTLFFFRILISFGLRELYKRNWSLQKKLSTTLYDMRHSEDMTDWSATIVGDLCYRTVHNPCVLKIVWTFNCFSRALGSNPHSW